MYGRMGVSRCRLAALAALFAVYLAAAILLSSVALHDTNPPSGVSSNKASGAGSVGMGLRLGSASAARSRRGRPRWCTDLSFVYPPRPPTALASFPGSGNTWLRYLLQQATGLHTGSVYKDFGLLKNGFPAEFVTNGSVLVVKTHEWGPLARTPFSQAVLLVRNPEKSIQAEFNRQSGGHIGFASPDRYRRAKGKYWQRFVAEKLLAWRQTNFDWLFNFTGSIHVVFYDDLVTKLEVTLKNLLKFLDIRLNEGLLQCALDRKEGIYRRKRRLLSFDPFTPNMKRALKFEQERVYEAIRRVQPQLSTPGR